MKNKVQIPELMIFFILFAYCLLIYSASKEKLEAYHLWVLQDNSSNSFRVQSSWNNLFAVILICRFIKMESCPIIWTPATKTHQVGCDSFAVLGTEKSRTSFPSSTVEISTTGRLERFPWERNFSYGMTKNIPRIWEYHWRCKIWRLWTPTVCHYGDEAT